MHGVKTCWVDLSLSAFARPFGLCNSKQKESVELIPLQFLYLSPGTTMAKRESSSLKAPAHQHHLYAPRKPEHYSGCRNGGCRWGG